MGFLLPIIHDPSFHSLHIPIEGIPWEGRVVRLITFPLAQVFLGLACQTLLILSHHLASILVGILVLDLGALHPLSLLIDLGMLILHLPLHLWEGFRTAHSGVTLVFTLMDMTIDM